MNITNFQNELYSSYNKRVEEFKATDKCLVHYTTADTALKILSNNELWLCSVNGMNDYNEMRTGMKKIACSINKNSYLQSLKNVLNATHPKLHETVIETLNTIHERYLATYGLCLSEASSEDVNGSTYMWDNYASQEGVAIQFNKNIFSYELPLPELVPMEYYTVKEVDEEIEHLIKLLNDHQAEVDDQDFDILMKLLLDKISYGVFCLKSQKYEQEKEWRVMLNDKLQNVDYPYLKKERVIIRNESRDIYKFNLSLAGIELNNVLHRIIIGRFQDPEKVKEEFIKLLSNKIDDIENKIIILSK